MSGDAGRTQAEIIDEMLAEHGWTIEYDLSPIVLERGDSGEDWRAMSTVRARLVGATLAEATSLALAELERLFAEAECRAAARARCHGELVVGEWLDRIGSTVHHPRPMSELAGTHTDFDAMRSSGVSVGRPMTTGDVPRSMDSYVTGTLENLDALVARLESDIEHLDGRLRDVLEPEQPLLAETRADGSPPHAPLVNAINVRCEHVAHLLDRLERITGRIAL